MKRFTSLLSVFVMLELMGIRQTEAYTVDTSVGAIYHERRLLKYLLQDYNTAIRPVADPKNSLDLTLGFALTNFEDLDEKTQAFVAHLWVRHFWTDVQLKWNASEFGGLDKIRLSPGSIWIPDLTVYNGVGYQYEYVKYSLAIVKSDGRVVWIPPVRVQTSCPLDITQFPYDTQICTVVIGSWTYDGSMVNLMVSNDTFIAEDSSGDKHQAWKIVDSSLRRNSVTYPCCPEPYHDVRMTISLKRRPGYLHRVFVAPSVIIAFVLPAIFLLPADAGEKTTLGAGILVSQVLLLMMLEDFMPTAHPTVPLLGLYYMANIILIGFALIFSTIVVNIWKRGNQPISVPGVFRGLFLGILGRLLFVKREDFMSLADIDPSGVRTMDGMSCDPATGSSANEDKTQLVTRVTNTAEWRQFATVVDRLLFVAYVIVLLCITIGMLSPPST